MSRANLSEKLNRGESKEKKVKFPQELVFDDIVKDGDSSEIVHFLRRQSVDVDVNKTNENGTTALNDLIKNGNLKCARVLINLGADVNRKDKHGLTPLHFAAQSGSLAVAKFLLESRANPDIGDNKGLFPVDYSEDFEMIELLTAYSSHGSDVTMNNKISKN